VNTDLQVHHPRRHGFRFSIWDAVILLVGGGVVLRLWQASNPLWWIAAMALGHFFLFCNVFLVWRRWELLWAAAFTMNMTLHLAFDFPMPWSVLLCQFPLTLFVIFRQIRSPWYHGICAETLNPRLEDYLNDRL